MDQDQDDALALARAADDGNPHADEDGDTGDDARPTTALDDGVTSTADDDEPGAALQARIAAVGPAGAGELVALIDALLTIGCHAVANLHPESTRDIPAAALITAAEHLPDFYPDRARASEIAQVWRERAAEVEAWRQRRLERGEPSPAPTPFPTAIAGQYAQKVHGSPGVFATHEIDTDRDGQPVVKGPKAPPTRRSPAAAGARKPAKAGAKAKAKKSAPAKGARKR